MFLVTETPRVFNNFFFLMLNELSGHFGLEDILQLGLCCEPTFAYFKDLGTT